MYAKTRGYRAERGRARQIGSASCPRTGEWIETWWETSSVSVAVTLQVGPTAPFRQGYHIIRTGQGKPVRQKNPAKQGESCPLFTSVRIGKPVRAVFDSCVPYCRRHRRQGG